MKKNIAIFGILFCLGTAFTISKLMASKPVIIIDKYCREKPQETCVIDVDPSVGAAEEEWQGYETIYLLGNSPE